MKAILIAILLALIVVGCDKSTNARITELSRENEALRQSLLSITNNGSNIQVGEISIKVLKIYERGGAAWIDFNLSNKSDRFLDYLEIGADVFDRHSNYLGNSFTIGENVIPRGNRTAKLIFSGVNAGQIMSWRFFINKASVGIPGGQKVDMTANFNLTLAK